MNTSLLVRCVLLLGLFACLGCGGGDTVSRGSLRGQVTIGGQPLASGRVLLTPIAPNQGPVASAMIVDGKYMLEKRQGPVVGLNRVTIEATPNLGFALDDEAAYAMNAHKPLPPDPIPAHFGRQSTQQVTIAGDQENNFDVVIPQAAPRW